MDRGPPRSIYIRSNYITAIRPIQPPPISPRRRKRDFATRMRFMELNTALYIQFRGRKLPYRPIQFFGREACGAHAMEEVSPRYLTWFRGGRRSEEHCLENIQRALVHPECRLDVRFKSVEQL